MASDSDDELHQPEPNRPDHARARTEPEPDVPPRRGHRSQLTVALVAGAVLVAGGGGAYWAASAADHPGGAAASQGAPPPLALTTDPGMGIAPGPVRLTGTLPAGPASAPVYRPGGQVSGGQVGKLAAALGVRGPVSSLTGVWKVAPAGGGRGPTLQVGKDAPDSWAFARDGAGSACKPPTPSGAVAHDQICYGAAGAAAGIPAKGGSAVSEARAEQLTAPVFAALGLGGAQVDASQTVAGGIRIVTADPAVGGLPTHGWSTSLQVGPDGTLLNGAGRMAPLARGATYPVVSARQAMGGLRQPGNTNVPPPQPCGTMHPGATRPGMMHPGAKTSAGGAASATAPVRGNAPCIAATPPVNVTGARFGLSLQFVGGRQELVPSWLFRVTQPVAGARPTALPAISTLAEPAVDPKFIARPTATPPPSLPTPPGSGSGGTKPSVERVQSYAASGRTVTLRFWGGLCSTYSAKVVGQSADAVRLQVTGVVKNPRQKCPMLAKSVTVTATLAQPLGDRKVYDSSDGHPVPAS